MTFQELSKNYLNILMAPLKSLNVLCSIISGLTCYFCLYLNEALLGSSETLITTPLLFVIIVYKWLISIVLP